MLSFGESIPRLLLNMPRVVADQKAKFESDELFKKLSRESEVRYTGHRDRPIDERRLKFKSACREGFTEIAFVGSGIHFQLYFGSSNNGCRNNCEFEPEKGKVHLRSSFILNGVCVRWKGTLDVERLDGVGCIEFDDELARVEDARLQQQIKIYNERMRHLEESQRSFLPSRMSRGQHEISEEMSSGSVSN